MWGRSVDKKSFLSGTLWPQLSVPLGALRLFRRALFPRRLRSASGTGRGGPLSSGPSESPQPAGLRALPSALGLAALGQSEGTQGWFPFSPRSHSLLG